MLLKATKFCKQKCYFLAFFCPADDQVAHYITMCKRHQGRTRQSESVSERAGFRQLNEQFVF